MTRKLPVRIGLTVATMAVSLVLLFSVQAMSQSDCPRCQTAIKAGGWCDDCQVGYVDGQKVKCKTCYQAMTAKDGGWCDECKVGYRGGKKVTCRACFEGKDHKH